MKYALAVLLLSVPALAQNRAAEIDFENALHEAQEAAKVATEKRAAIERTLVAMNDGIEAGGVVVSYLRDHGIEVVPAVQPEAVKTVVVAGKKVIRLSVDLPAYPRVYGPLIAKEVASMIYADMPACSERSYMRRAVAARVWTELGGEFSKLPVVEPLTGDRVAAVSDEIAPWGDANGAEMALYKIGEAEKLQSIPELQDAAKDAAAKAALDAANARFVAFLIDEKLARRAAGLR
ncbi:MAG: hypothetical protein M0D55_15485 [Elusimicrobiota bacterium]|nr:MAG: hypothetical protein M0D55_15485 [Elusimicrobiota bacterium]